MSRYRRSHATGATFFFTVTSYRRRRILTHAGVREACRQAIEQVRSGMPFTIDAWVLLPDHLHAIWTLPVGDSAYGQRWGMIKAHVSRRCAHLVAIDSERRKSRIERHERDFWQRRFWEHQVRDERDFQRHMDYLHYNPVKHGLVKRVVDWPHSTFHRYVRHGTYPESWASDPGTVIESAGE